MVIIKHLCIISEDMTIWGNNPLPGCNMPPNLSIPRKAAIYLTLTEEVPFITRCMDVV
jgi:hypothetical protein